MIHCYSLVAKAKTRNLWASLQVRVALCQIHTAGVCVMSCSVAISSSAYRLGTATSVHHGALPSMAALLISNVLFESWTSQTRFLTPLSPALIDAIPLSVLSKLRNFLWLGSKGLRFGAVPLFAFFDANTLGVSLHFETSSRLGQGGYDLGLWRCFNKSSKLPANKRCCPRRIVQICSLEGKEKRLFLVLLCLSFVCFE